MLDSKQCLGIVEYRPWLSWAGPTGNREYRVRGRGSQKTGKKRNILYGVWINVLAMLEQKNFFLERAQLFHLHQNMQFSTLFNIGTAAILPASPMHMEWSYDEV